MELADTKKAELSVLDSLAAQAQMFAINAKMNILQLGRVLTEAKPLVEHGKWREWIKTNTDMSTRGAEQCMQAYARFGLDPKIAELGTTKMLKLLPLTEEEQEDLFSGNDVRSLSTRQLEEAIRNQKEKLAQEARTEARAEIYQERMARIAAEKRAEAVENRNPEVPEEIKEELRKKDQTIKEQQEKLREAAREFGSTHLESESLRSEIRSLKAELREKDELIEEQQEDYNHIQSELLNMKSTIAKGDAERAPLDALTPEAFASAVRSFIGMCARMPHMAGSFACMEYETRREYDELLKTVESWAEASRKALETITVEGTVTVRE